MIELSDGSEVQVCGVTENIGGGWRMGKWPEPNLRYCIRDQHPLMSKDTWEAEIAWALEQWSKAFELNFERTDDPRPGRAHFLISVGNLGGPGGVLAQATLIPPGVIRNDDFQSVLTADSLDKFTGRDRAAVAMQVVIGEVFCHEVGHSLGLVHDESTEVALMDPVYNSRISGLQPRDVMLATANGYIRRKAMPPSEPTPVPPTAEKPLGPVDYRRLATGVSYTPKKRAWVIEEL